MLASSLPRRWTRCRHWATAASRLRWAVSELSWLFLPALKYSLCLDVELPEVLVANMLNPVLYGGWMMPFAFPWSLMWTDEACGAGRRFAGTGCGGLQQRRLAVCCALESHNCKGARHFASVTRCYKLLETRKLWIVWLILTFVRQSIHVTRRGVFPIPREKSDRGFKVEHLEYFLENSGGILTIFGWNRGRLRLGNCDVFETCFVLISRTRYVIRTIGQ